MSRKNVPLALAAIGATAAIVATARALRAPAPPVENPVVVVTGGSRGLGYAIASRYARSRARLVLAARDAAELEQARRSLLAEHPHMTPEDIHLVAVDLSTRAGCEHLILQTIHRFSRIDILVNNAGIIQCGPAEAQPIEAFEAAMRINFFAALYTTFAALPHMMSQRRTHGRRGTIINIASIGGKVAVPHLLPYTASKFALVGFSEGLHAEVRGKGVHVTTVCPGLMRTGGEEHAHFVGNADRERGWFQFAAKTPGIATTATHAAERIYSAAQTGASEIIITPQAWLLARFHGLAPEAVQRINSLVNDWLLPSAEVESLAYGQVLR